MPADDGSKLTTQEYWDDTYRARLAHSVSAEAGGRGRIKNIVPDWLLRLRRSWYRELAKRRLPPHADWQLWEVLLRPLLANRGGGQALEVGSAPGARSLAIYDRFGLEPHGLEYSPAGVALQRANYRARGLPEHWVEQGDLFDGGLRARWAGRFDMVASYGFIEHFDNPSEVVGMHMELLRPGGVLAITVPHINEGTWYGRLVRRFNPGVYGMHNVSTCTLETFRQLFERLDCEIMFCGTLGGPDVTFVPDGRWRSRFVAAILRGLNIWTNRLNHLLLGRRLAAFPRTASALAAIAVKKESAYSAGRHERTNS